MSSALSESLKAELSLGNEQVRLISPFYDCPLLASSSPYFFSQLFFFFFFFFFFCTAHFDSQKKTRRTNAASIIYPFVSNSYFGAAPFLFDSWTHPHLSPPPPLWNSLLFFSFLLFLHRGSNCTWKRPICSRKRLLKTTKNHVSCHSCMNHSFLCLTISFFRSLSLLTFLSLSFFLSFFLTFNTCEIARLGMRIWNWNTTRWSRYAAHRYIHLLLSITQSYSPQAYIHICARLYDWLIFFSSFFFGYWSWSWKCFQIEAELVKALEKMDDEEEFLCQQILANNPLWVSPLYFLCSFFTFAFVSPWCLR